MYRFLFTTGTSTGHVNPVLPVARTLVERGHQVVWITGRADRAKVDSTGARFHAFPETIDTSLVGIYEFFPNYVAGSSLGGPGDLWRAVGITRSKGMTRSPCGRASPTE